MGKFLHFLYNTYIGQEKNRRDVLDYLWAISVIIMFVMMVWAIIYYGFNWR
jgi:hypothetical protein